MVRLFSTTLIYMLAASYYMARRSSQNPRAILQLALREAGGEGNRDMERIFGHAMNQESNSPGTMAAVISEATEAYQKSRPDNDDGSHGSVIDAIVEILKLPYALNSFSSNQLLALRRALLFPNEMSTFLTTSGAQEMTCAGCKRLFGSGHMATFHHRDTVSGFYCVHCIPPEKIHCQCGNGPVTVDDNVIQNILNTPCPHKSPEVPQEMYGSINESLDIESPSTRSFTMSRNIPAAISRSMLENAVRDRIRPTGISPFTSDPMAFWESQSTGSNSTPGNPDE